MKKSIILSLSFLFLLSFPMPAFAACCKGMDKEQCEHMNMKGMADGSAMPEKGMCKKKSAMMKEMHEIVLQTIILLKEEAKSKKSKTKASELEKRLRKHIEDMDKHHAGMKGMNAEEIGGMKGKKPCEHSDKK